MEPISVFWIFKNNSSSIYRTLLMNSANNSYIITDTVTYEDLVIGVTIVNCSASDTTSGSIMEKIRCSKPDNFDNYNNLHVFKIFRINK